MDAAVVTELFDLVEKAMGLFKIWPLNLMIGAGIATVAFAVITAARGATGV